MLPVGRTSARTAAKSGRSRQSLMEAQRVLSAQQGGASIAIPDLLKLGDALKKTGTTVWGRLRAAVFGCPAQPVPAPPAVGGGGFKGYGPMARGGGGACGRRQPMPMSRR
jgi:hypothetical protein